MSAYNDLLECLTPREKEVLVRRLGLEGEKETLQRIGDDYKVSRERIRQIQNKAIKKLKSRKNKSLIEDLFEEAHYYGQ